MSKPIAVVISDIHFTVPTLDLATKVLHLAMDKALELKVPLIIAGDTLDSKAIMRGECVNRLLDIFENEETTPHTFLMVGNHDLLNEKASEHSLNFLGRYVAVVSHPLRYILPGVTLVPYQSNKQDVIDIVDTTKGILVLHQGVRGAHMGHYAIDNSSLPLETFKGRTVISGHYHQAQTLNIPGGGTFTYIGNPYTLNFGEANDPPKGFLVLNEDGSFERIPTNLRRHVVAEVTPYKPLPKYPPDTLLWVKVRGTRSELSIVNKELLGQDIIGHSNFKLDLIPTDDPKFENTIENRIDREVLDAIIESLNEGIDRKDMLKRLWREVIDETT